MDCTAHSWFVAATKCDYCEICYSDGNQDGAGVTGEEQRYGAPSNKKPPQKRAKKARGPSKARAL